MTAVIQLAALCLLGSAMINHEAIEHWLLTHKPLNMGSYALMGFLIVAAVVWLLGGLGELL